MARRGGRQPGKGLSFEDALERLEEVVHELEGGSLPLEDALAAFQEGIGLVRACQERLKAAELQLQELLAEGEDLRLVPLTLPEKEESKGGPKGTA